MRFYGEYGLLLQPGNQKAELTDMNPVCDRTSDKNAPAVGAVLTENRQMPEKIDGGEKYGAE